MLSGSLLAESLQTGAELRVAGVKLTRLSRQDVSESATAAQPPVWTVLEFEADDDAADTLSLLLSRSLRAQGGWYADFTVGRDHVVVFADRIFRYRRDDPAGRTQAVEYGRTVGVPEHQLDWPD